ncbi:MAG: right-handed parallel beta-helix repeat-containing protein, partial [Thermomicrobiales bacterium]
AVIPIAAGTYPTAPIILAKSVTLKACNDAAGVILSKVAPSDSYMLQDETASDATREVMLDGLTFQGLGSSDSYGLTQANGSSNWTVTNCEFRNAKGGWFGKGGNGSFSGCTFSVADIATNLPRDKGDIFIENCTFSGAYRGLYLSVQSGSQGQNTATVSNCSITGSTKEGAYFGGWAEANLTGCTVTGNGDGGVVLQTGTLSISKTTISGNTATFYGGGIAIRQKSTLTVGSSVVVTGNTAPDGSGLGALFLSPDYPTITGVSSSNIYGNLRGDQCEADSTSTGGGFIPVPNCSF